MQSYIRAFLAVHGSEYRVEESKKLFICWCIPGGYDYEHAYTVASFVDDAAGCDKLAEKYGNPPELAMCGDVASDFLLRLDYSALQAFLEKHMRDHPDVHVSDDFYDHRGNLCRDFVRHFHLENSELPWIQRFISNDYTSNSDALYHIRRFTIGTNPPKNKNMWRST